MLGLSASYGSSKSSSEQSAAAKTLAKNLNKGGSNKVAIVGDAGKASVVPEWVLVAAVILVALVVVALVLASIG